MSSWQENEEILSSLSEENLEDDFYLILNVSKEATDKEITQAYHKFGLLYHPDKHKDPEKKQNAEILFYRVKRAYDVLIDPHTRAIYDSIGIKGLEQDNLKIIIRSKTPQEIREEYERLAKEREEQMLEKLTFSKGYFSMNINAANIFDKIPTYQNEYGDESGYSLVSIEKFQMNQSIDLPLTNTNKATLGGNLVTGKNNYQTGSLIATLRRILSPESYLDFKCSIGGMKMLSMTAYRRLTEKLTGSINAEFKYSPEKNSIIPTFSSEVFYQLDNHLIGNLKYKTNLGVVSSMSTSLIYKKENLYAQAKFQLGFHNSYAELLFSRYFIDHQIKLNSSIRYGYLGASLSYGIEKQITKFSKIDATIIIGTLDGVTLNLEVDRGSQSFCFPIKLSSEIMPSAIFYGTVTPLIIYYVAKRLIIEPFLKEKEEREAQQKQEKLKSELIEKRRLALSAQNLMKETVTRILEKEGPNGLIITKAFYGKITDKNNPNFENEKIVDVLLPLQFLVVEHSLEILSDSSKCNLEGFYDPCIGEKKTLYIEYDFKGEKHQVILDDNNPIRLPKSSHKIQWWSKPFRSVKK